MQNSSIDLLRHLSYIIEQTLGEYESACLGSKPKQRTLNRLEDVLKQTFIPISKDMQENWKQLHSSGRVNELLRFMAHEDAEAALARFFLRNRYRQTSPEIRITVECPLRGPLVVRLFSDRSKATHNANGRTTLSHQQHNARETTRGGYLVENVVTGQVFDAGGEISEAVLKQVTS